MIRLNECKIGDRVRLLSISVGLSEVISEIISDKLDYKIGVYPLMKVMNGPPSKGNIWLKVDDENMIALDGEIMVEVVK